MNKKAFSIYDTKAEVYQPPFFTAAKGLAIRSFIDAVNDPQTMLNKHPEDFVLYQIGEFDEDKGELVPTPAETLGKAIEYIKEQ